jgi:hypothetical protein
VNKVYNAKNKYLIAIHYRKIDRKRVEKSENLKQKFKGKSQRHMGFIFKKS